ncbi:hypothetical protein V5799_006947 [Amblyomma americanum]|uniref:Uncharacterized protein n=1 Tax=Amblyomma americanum TaxID=6943 RepID=A0AAQ4DUY3_AMBAM
MVQQVQTTRYATHTYTHAVRVGKVERRFNLFPAQVPTKMPAKRKQLYQQRIFQNYQHTTKTRLPASRSCRRLGLHGVPNALPRCSRLNQSHSPVHRHPRKQSFVLANRLAPARTLV